MGQTDVMSHLKKIRRCGDNDFKTANQIIKGLQSEGLTNGALRRVRVNLVQLQAFGFVESKINSKKGEWKRIWRVKNKYV